GGVLGDGHRPLGSVRGELSPQCNGPTAGTQTQKPPVAKRLRGGRGYVAGRARPFTAAPPSPVRPPLPRLQQLRDALPVAPQPPTNLRQRQSLRPQFGGQIPPGGVGAPAPRPFRSADTLG